MEQQSRARLAVEVHFRQFNMAHEYKCVGLSEDFHHATLQVSGQEGDYVIQCQVEWVDDRHEQVMRVTDRQEKRG